MSGRDKGDVGTIVLENGRLRVEIDLPGVAYSESRFDWTGWVRQVTLDGRHTFCSAELAESVAEPEGPGGFGLCGEFGILEPIGYDDCEPGERFPKLGVGLLLREDDEPYRFHRPYAIEPFPVEVERGSDGSVIIRSKPLPCRGYEATYIKTVRLDGDSLILGSELSNVGTRTIRTTEYNHNFVRINGEPIGSAYELKLPFLRAELENDHPLLDFGAGDTASDTMGWTGEADPERAFYAMAKRFETETIDAPSWTLTHRSSGVGFSETLDRPLLRFAVWGMAHVVSPELFHEIVLEPGESLRWSRTYRFFHAG